MITQIPHDGRSIAIDLIFVIILPKNFITMNIV